jgi:myotubularin-related protein 6/7/8
MTPETSFGDTEALEDELIASTASQGKDEGPRVYGAQQNNLIVDARPTVNAFAMQAVGMGSENMDNYPFATKAYLGIDNIHVMRDSLQKVIDTLKESDLTPLGPSREALAKSGWLKHIANMLDGVSLIVRQVGLQHSHVVIHCSDGWDRTSQLSALSQLCLDPYYRTLDGFIVLVEKDWLSFGHMFAHRAGHLSSEKWFNIENERVGGDGARSTSTHAPSGGNALENAFLSAKGFFNKDNKSSTSLVDSDSEINPMDESSPSRKPGTKGADKHVTKVKETSPVFHQFLDATYQLLSQHPDRFEFNERFLRRLLYHLYSCQYGTFLYNSEKDRRDAKVKERTRSVWDYFVSRREQFINPNYKPRVDDNERGAERLIFPTSGKVRWWNEVFGRTDAEMNGPAQAQHAPPEVSQRAPTLTGVETSEAAVGPGASSALGGNAEPTSRASGDMGGEGAGASSPPSGNGAVQGVSEALSRGVAALGVGVGQSKPKASRRSEEVHDGMSEMHEMGKKEMEVEMQ